MRERERERLIFDEHARVKSEHHTKAKFRRDVKMFHIE